MPRKVNEKGEDIYVLRSRNWECKVQDRQFALAHPVKVRRCLAALLDHIRPTLNVYGCAVLSVEQEAELWSIWEIHCRNMGAGMRSRLIWWYWSDEGWAELQRLWDELPEPVHISARVVHNSERVVHSSPVYN